MGNPQPTEDRNWQAMTQPLIFWRGKSEAQSIWFLTGSITGWSLAAHGAISSTGSFSCPVSLPLLPAFWDHLPHNYVSPFLVSGSAFGQTPAKTEDFLEVAPFDI